MSTKPMTPTAQKKKLRKPVTRGELATLLSDWARAADASLTVKMETMRAELIAELRPDLVVTPPSDNDAQVPDRHETPVDWAANMRAVEAHIVGAPTGSEGEE